MSVFESAAIVLSCEELDPAVAFFTETLGFRLDMISPADDPAVAVLSGHGLRLRLDRNARAAPATLQLSCATGRPRTLVAPNGTCIEIVPLPQLEIPPLKPAVVLSRAGDAQWVEGRAGMRYRDLIPCRLGGRYIGSHIQIREGGAVPDYVHHHQIQFQLIYVLRGSVEVAYEAQGAPVVMREGDCVLQPPHIRHRVLCCSAGLEVLEVACPAAHPTFADHELKLPTPTAERDFDGQRFVHHVADDASWVRSSGTEQRDTGLGAASAGLVDVRVRRLAEPEVTLRCQGELNLFFVHSGSARVHGAGIECQVREGDAAVFPAGQQLTWAEASPSFELVGVTAPAP